MVGYINLLTGIGMIAVAIVPLAYWHITRRPGLRYFAFGAVLWAASIMLKVILELTLTGMLVAALKPVLPGVMFVAVISAYVGLRTGIIESGLTYLGVRQAKLSSIGLNDAIAMGIGFGGAEAAFFGALSMLIVMSLLMLGPTALDALPEADKALLLEQFTIMWMPIPIIERAFTMLCHIASTVLAIYAVKLNDLRWLGLSIAIRAILDTPIPFLEYYLAPIHLGGQAVIESWVAMAGILSLVLLLWFMARVQPARHARG